ncbi:MAG: helix-turn-helix transcriptional regulator [Clostridia bacterium]|jgi:transcriptional regulator with XRE-family HTH domain|nr:helix-turn-helix transcriptional regulator [Clostridia bacterium]
MNNLFSERLSELIADNKISKRALAKAIGVSAMSVSDWSNGKVQPTAENIYLIAKHFDVSADFLLGLEYE